MPEFVNPTRTHGLVDILDRVLDKGLVIAGDIKINLANVELLTIQVRLLICSIDKAEQIGLNWWRNDPRLTGRSTDVSMAAGQSGSAKADRSRQASNRVRHGYLCRACARKWRSAFSNRVP